MASIVMTPAPGERLLRFVGDRVRFTARFGDVAPLPQGWKAFLRTNIGGAKTLRDEQIRKYAKLPVLAVAAWRDVPFQSDGNESFVEFVLTESGFFSAKAFVVDARGRQHWPDGANVDLVVHPDQYRTGNTIYCAFTRMFGGLRAAVATFELDPAVEKLDKLGYSVIPPSGRLRDLKEQLPHIMDVLGCRILHLLPIHPTPTTYARLGRYGSPYASQDLSGVDLTLVEFDRRTTGIDQFHELASAVHAKGGRVFLDFVTNHTGWGSTLQEKHPEWFLRDEKGSFVSPGAWGTIWEDLVEIDHRNPRPWEYLADTFLEWCRRGADGFRCDAGYKVPLPAWQYITARVQSEFPDTIFLLEGLGGPWETTEQLLTEGGMQWAYSELFQNYSGSEIARYLDYALRQSERVGLYIHYSETHDNERLAKKGKAWSLLRNRLSALSSVSGGYGLTCGVEWLAVEKIQVHSCRGLAWGNPDNLVAEIGRLNRLLRDHPCFFDGATARRVSPPASDILALRRDSKDGMDRLLILLNTDVEKAQRLALPEALFKELGEPCTDLLGQSAPKFVRGAGKEIVFELGPGACFCLSEAETPKSAGGARYRKERAAMAWAAAAANYYLLPEELARLDEASVQAALSEGARGYLAAVAGGFNSSGRLTLEPWRGAFYPEVVNWSLADSKRKLMVPPGHWLLVEDEGRFRARLEFADGRSVHLESIRVGGKEIACFWPRFERAEAVLKVERYGLGDPEAEGRILFLGGMSAVEDAQPPLARSATELEAPMVLLTNGIGGMCRLAVDLGKIKSKYDCLLGANLNSSVPVDRHVLVKRVRIWANAAGFISPLDGGNLIAFEPGPPARWKFLASAGDGRSATIQLEVDMVDGANAVVVALSRLAEPPRLGRDLEQGEVRLTLRFDLEDRNFHQETRWSPAADYHFRTHSKGLPDQTGFVFSPADDRKLWVVAERGEYIPEAEWSYNIAHPVEASRGQVAQSDCYSPGWFDVPLAKGEPLWLTVTAGTSPLTWEEAKRSVSAREAKNQAAVAQAGLNEKDRFERQLALATQAFVVRRGAYKTVIAGYPWFLDWGRDSLICARGLLAGGMVDEVIQTLLVFGKFETNGTLPNSIFGEDASNRDTSDAPLWFGVACEEAAAIAGQELFARQVDGRGRTLREILRDIALGYLRGTPNGIEVDRTSGLVWSPAHFTWMDTNYPAGTPREGYPIEIQALWIRLLQLLERLQVEKAGESWGDLAVRASSAAGSLFWLEEKGYFSDVLLARKGVTAETARADTALRSNYLLAISLGLLTGEPARMAVQSAIDHLLVPGALRTLAPLTVDPPLEIWHQGRLLDDPRLPYSGRYEGDEDTRRKPAYHNGTAWTWTFPGFCEALARAWDFEPAAVAAAKAYLRSMEELLWTNCLGQLPEIVDGDFPHLQRGCDAQAWGATEALRVWKILQRAEQSRKS